MLGTHTVLITLSISLRDKPDTCTVLLAAHWYLIIGLLLFIWQFSLTFTQYYFISKIHFRRHQKEGIHPGG